MRSFRLLAAGASLALFLSACSSGGAPTSPTSAPAPTSAAPKPAVVASPSPAAVASPSPGIVASPSPVVAASPAVSPVVLASPSAAAASPVAAGGPKPTVKIGSANFPENVVLGELYAQMLEANGYTVDRHLNLGTREIIEPALESGQIDMYPEYIATMLAFVSKDPNLQASSDPATTFKNLQTALQPKNITVLNYAQAQDENGFAVTQDTAQKYNLKNMSDLAPVASQLVLGGAPECPQRPFCLPGLQQTYGLQFKDFKPLDAGGPLTVQALQSGDIDVGELFTTDPNISAMNFVELNDDKHLQLSDNVAPVVRNQILSQGPDIQTLCNQVSAKLTTNDLIDLNKSVELDHQDPKDVAAAYLKQQGLTH